MSSAKTSRNQIAGGFKKIDWSNVSVNFDVGGGKYHKASIWLWENYSVRNLIYDPYNQTRKSNKLNYQKAAQAETATIFNTLNVIPSLMSRKRLLHIARRPNVQQMFITVYEGNKSGVGKKTRDGWQANRKLVDYLDEVKEIFDNVVIYKGVMIVSL